MNINGKTVIDNSLPLNILSDKLLKGECSGNRSIKNVREEEQLILKRKQNAINTIDSCEFDRNPIFTSDSILVKSFNKTIPYKAFKVVMNRNNRDEFIEEKINSIAYLFSNSMYKLLKRCDYFSVKKVIKDSSFYLVLTVEFDDYIIDYKSDEIYFSEIDTQEKYLSLLKLKHVESKEVVDIRDEIDTIIGDAYIGMYKTEIIEIIRKIISENESMPNMDILYRTNHSLIALSLVNIIERPIICHELGAYLVELYKKNKGNYVKALYESYDEIKTIVFKSLDSIMLSNSKGKLTKNVFRRIFISNSYNNTINKLKSILVNDIKNYYVTLENYREYKLKVQNVSSNINVVNSMTEKNILEFIDFLESIYENRIDFSKVYYERSKLFVEYSFLYKSNIIFRVKCSIYGEVIDVDDYRLSFMNELNIPSIDSQDKYIQLIYGVLDAFNLYKSKFDKISELEEFNLIKEEKRYKEVMDIFTVSKDFYVDADKQTISICSFLFDITDNREKVLSTLEKILNEIYEFIEDSKRCAENFYKDLNKNFLAYYIENLSEDNDTYSIIDSIKKSPLNNIVVNKLKFMSKANIENLIVELVKDNILVIEPYEYENYEEYEEDSYEDSYYEEDYYPGDEYYAYCDNSYQVKNDEEEEYFSDEYEDGILIDGILSINKVKLDYCKHYNSKFRLNEKDSIIRHLYTSKEILSLKKEVLADIFINNSVYEKANIIKIIGLIDEFEKLGNLTEFFEGFLKSIPEEFQKLLLLKLKMVDESDIVKIKFLKNIIAK